MWGQVVQTPRHQPITEKTKALIDKLLLLKIPLAGIARVTGVSPRWLQYYINQKFASVPRQVQVKSKKRARTTIQCDEMWSFVGPKGNKQWVWLAIDVFAKEIVGVYIGSRDEAGAKALWDSLPPVYRQCAITSHRFLELYSRVFPQSRHKAVGKETGNTPYI